MKNPFTAKNLLIAVVLAVFGSFGWFTVIQPKLWAYTAGTLVNPLSNSENVAEWSDYGSSDYTDGGWYEGEYTEDSYEDWYEEWYSDETCDENDGCSGIQKISLVSPSNEENSWDLGGYWSDFYDETDFGFWGFELDLFEANLEGDVGCDFNEESYCA